MSLECETSIAAPLPGASIHALHPGPRAVSGSRGEMIKLEFEDCALPWRIPTVRVSGILNNLCSTHLTRCQELWTARSQLFTEEQKTEAWSRTADIMKTYSDELVKRWNSEIDTLLVYVSYGGTGTCSSSLIDGSV